MVFVLSGSFSTAANAPEEAHSRPVRSAAQSSSLMRKVFARFFYIQILLAKIHFPFVLRTEQRNSMSVTYTGAALQGAVRRLNCCISACRGNL